MVTEEPRIRTVDWGRADIGILAEVEVAAINE
jgi:hypothetical protein